jgi:subtilisin family serine protease
MYAYKRATASPRDEKFASPSEELRLAVTFRRPGGHDGPTKFMPPLSLSTVGEFKPDPMAVDEALYHLSRLGFRPTRRGNFTASVRCSRALFERTFSTQLSAVQLDRKVDYAFPSLYYPAEGAPWSMPPDLGRLIDDAYIQWPHIYMGRKTKVRGTGRAKMTAKVRSDAPRAGTMAGAFGATVPSLKPPTLNYFHLSVPDGVAGQLNADKVHKAGTTGKGVRVAMVDTGFAHSHPYFAAKGYTTSVDLAPHANNDATDVNGHGTGESANMLAVAPGVTFIGIKVDNDGDPRGGASMLEGFQQALLHDPQVISLSMGFDLRNTDGTQMSELPNNMAALEAEIQAAIARGIIVVFSAGNGHFSFPGMMPNVISAGGVFVDESGGMEASDYASAFQSKIYPGRAVPDFSGLVGMLPNASYIELPVPPGSETDREQAAPDEGQGDGTAPDDGWGVFSGTSAAAPQLAGICALLLEKNPKLSPADAKAILRRTARSVTKGAANPTSSDDNVGEPASASDTGATGAGLIDAFAAWQQL